MQANPAFPSPPALLRGVPALPALAALIGAFTVVRLVLAATAPLLPQEAYYWTWSRYLDTSYFDHPPLASWTIFLTTTLFGSSTFGVKAAAVLWSIGWNVLWLRLILDGYGDRKLAFRSLLALNLTLLYEVLGFAPTPDGPLLFGWIGAIWAVSRAAATGQGRWWYAAGAFTGIACLGKYAGVLLPVVVAVFLAASPTQRHWLRRREPYLALLIAALLVSPVVLWNMQHDWVSFAFQSTRRFGEMGTFKPRFFLVLLATQALMVTPYLFFVSLREAWRSVRDGMARRIDDRDRLLLVSALLPIALFTAVSFVANAKIQWLTPAWWSLVILAMHRLPARPLERKRLSAGLVSSAAVLATGIAVSLIPDLPIPGNLNTWSGWRDAATRVDALETTARAEGATTFVFSPNYKISSLIWFHRKRGERTYAQDILGERALQYDHFPANPHLLGGTGFLVLSDQEQSKVDMAKVARRFDTMQRVEVLRSGRGARTTRTIEIWRCTGYRGPAVAGWP